MYAFFKVRKKSVKGMEGRAGSESSSYQNPFYAPRMVLKLQTETDRLQKRQDAAAREIGAAACLSTAS